MLQIRRMIERSKEPCVIEIFDDDDDDEDVHVAQHDKRNEKNDRDVIEVLDSWTAQGTSRKRVGKRLKRDRNNDDPIILSHRRRKASNENTSTTVSRNDVVIDLTAAAASDIPIAVGSKGNWSCGRCTYKNQAGADCCEMCLGRR